MTKQKRLTAREVAAVLKEHGFVMVSQKGSHQKWKNEKTGKQVIVPQHRGKQLPIGTMNSIIKGSGVSGEEW